MATNLQGSSHRPRAVGFRLRNRKDFIYEQLDHMTDEELDDLEAELEVCGEGSSGEWNGTH